MKKRMWTGLTIMAFVILTIAPVRAQRQIDVQVNGSGQDINVSQDTNQRILRTYVLEGLPIEQRDYEAGKVIDMLRQDGRGGGYAQGGILYIPGQTEVRYAVIRVSATPDMQATVKDALGAVFTLDDYVREAWRMGKRCTVTYDRTTITKYYVARYQPAKRLREIAQTLLSPIGSISSDDRMVIIDDSAEELPWIMEKIEQYDQPDYQRHVEVTMIEVRRVEGRQAGVYWQSFKEFLPQGVDAWIKADPWVNPNHRSIDINTVEFMVNFINVRSLANVFRLMSDENLLRVVDRQTIVIANDQQSRLFLGNRIHYRISRDGDLSEERVNEAGASLTIDSQIALHQVRLYVTINHSSLLGVGQDGEATPTNESFNSATPIQMAEDRMYLLSLNRAETQNRQRGFFRRDRGESALSRAVLIRLLPDDEQLRLIQAAEEAGQVTAAGQSLKPEQRLRNARPLAISSSSSEARATPQSATSLRPPLSATP